MNVLLILYNFYELDIWVSPSIDGDKPPMEGVLKMKQQSSIRLRSKALIR